jgi:hypothetical protein
MLLLSLTMYLWHAGCPAGTYFDEGVNDGDCVPCEFGSYCFKQLTWIPNTQTGQYGKTSCGVAGYTTRARRSTSVWDCSEWPAWRVPGHALQLC